MRERWREGEREQREERKEGERDVGVKYQLDKKS